MNIPVSNYLDFTWTNWPNPNNDPNNGSFIATLADGGVYEYEANCFPSGIVTGSITITVNPKPSITVLSDSPRCSGDAIHLSISGTGGSVWSWGGPNGFTSSEQNPILTTVTTAAAGSYTVTATSSNGCTTTASTLIEVNQTPDAMASSNSPICVGDPLNLFGSFGDSYQWSGPNGFSSNQQSPVILSNAQAGEYTVVISANIGCSSSASTSVVINEDPVITTIETTYVPCFDESTGSIKLTVSNGMEPYTFQWDPPVASDENPLGLSAGVYFVTVSDQHNCSTTASTSINQPSLPLGVSCYQGAPVSTQNGTDGKASVVLLGGTPPYLYSWMGPQSSSSTATQGGVYSINNLSIGTYAVVLTDANNCTSECSFSINSSDCSGFQVAITSTSPVSCHGGNNGSIALGVTGGTPPYGFNWDNNSLDGMQNPNGLSPTNYTVTVTDGAGCAVIENNITVGEPSTLQFSCNQTSPASNIAASDGAASINIGGGTAPYGYAWSGGTGNSPAAGPAAITGLSPGNYMVTLTDGNGCQKTCNLGVQAAGSVDCNHTDSLALVKIYDALGSTSWINHDYWLETSKPIGVWHGVQVDPTSGCVSVLQLINNGLTGEIPLEIGDLDSLKILELQQNDGLDGGIPDTLGSLHKLTLLNLSENTLSGEIPLSLGNLTNLQQLYLHLNSLTGTIPDTLGDLVNLTYLDLDNNLLTGDIPIGITDLTNLTGLELHTNHLTGIIHQEFEHLTNLTKLNLSYNLLEGSIPSTLANLSNLEYLNLSFNQLTGKIPHQLGQLSTNLQEIALQHNNLEGCFPAQLGSLCGIIYDFSENQGLPGGGDFFGFCNGPSPAITNNLGTIKMCAGESFTVGSNAYTIPDDYSATLDAVGGCDSIVNFTLDILPIPTGSYSAILCPDETVMVGDSIFNKDNSFGQVILDNAAYNGCDSVVNVSLSFHQPSTNNLTQTLCPAGSLTVNGKVYNEANPTGTEVIPGGSFHGCDSTVIVSLMFYPPSVNNLTDTLCTDGSLTVNSMLYNEANPTGTEVIIGGSFHGCDSTIFVNLSFNDTVVYQLSTIICLGNSIIVNGMVYDKDNPIGTETFFGGSYLGCDSLVSVNLMFYPSSVNNLTGPLCSGESIVVNGTNYGAANPYDTITLANASFFGCDSTININLSFYPPASSEYQQTLCPGESVTIGGMVFDEDNPTGLVTLPGLAANGCDSTIAVALDLVDITIEGIDTVLCEGDSLVANGLVFTTDIDTMLPFGGCDGIWRVSIDFLTVEECDELAADALVISQTCIAGIPNVITPAGSPGLNDSFDPVLFLEDCVGVNIDENGAELTIINRWGEAIFRRDAGHYEAWDGTIGNNNGSTLQQGAYYYYLKIRSRKKDYEIKGAVNLISGN